MNAILRASFALLPIGMLVVGSAILFFRSKNVYSLLQLFGAACLLVVVITHLFEALHLFPGMGWGLEDSVGHYVDLASAVLGVTLFPVGYVIHSAVGWR